MLLLLSLLLPILTHSSVKVDEIVKLINENIEVLKNEYQNYYQETWEMTKVESATKLYDQNDQYLGYFFSFDVGYLSVTKDFRLIEINTVDQSPLIFPKEKTYMISNGYYYKKGNQYRPNSSLTTDQHTLPGEALINSEIFTPLNDKINTTNFEVTQSVAKDLKTSNQKTGKYQVYTHYQSTTDCGPQAGINLVYTYKLSGVKDITNINNVYTGLTTMREKMNFKTDGKKYFGLSFLGVWPWEFSSGLKNFLPEKYTVIQPEYMQYEAPSVALYYNLNVANTAHFAMVIGEARSKNFWIFHTYYDIVSTWNSTHTLTNQGEINYQKVGQNSYYIVNQIHRNAIYEIHVKLKPAWYEFWKPTSKLLTN